MSDDHPAVEKYRLVMIRPREAESKKFCQQSSATKKHHVKVSMQVIRSLNEPYALSEPKTIVVLGCGRGGTSALAGCIRELGVTMPHAHPLKHEWSPILQQENGQVDKIKTKKIIENINMNHRNWGWKCPKDVFVLEDIVSTLRNPIVVIVFRNLFATALSGERHEDVSWELSINEQAAVQLNLANFLSRSAIPVIVLAYEQMVSSPDLVVDELRSALAIGSSDAQAANGVSFLKLRKYSRLLNSEETQDFSEEELAVDANLAQRRLYASAIEQLKASELALLNDIISADAVIKNLHHQLGIILSQNVTSPLTYAPELLSSSLAGEEMVMRLLLMSEVEINSSGADLAKQCVATLSSISELDLQIAKDLASVYARSRRRYASALRRRIELQGKIETLEEKLNEAILWSSSKMAGEK